MMHCCMGLLTLAKKARRETDRAKWGRLMPSESWQITETRCPPTHLSLA